MSDEYGEFPGIRTIDTSNLDIPKPEDEFVHLDDIEEPEVTSQFRVYVYRDEDRYEELAETVNDLRKEYIFATGIVWPSWMRDEMPLETEVLVAVEWALAFGGRLTPNLLEDIKKELQKDDWSDRPN